MSFNNYELIGSELTILYILLGIFGVCVLLGIGLFSMWIYYSWIRKENSKNYTGEDITSFILNKTGNNDLEIQKSWMYMKYWNYNKKKRTHKLRPWTFNRRSIWTMMEASQQAYATSIRRTKGKTYWLLFRIPFVFRIIGLVLGVIAFYMGANDMKSFDNISASAWLWYSLGFTIMFLFYVIADVGKIYVLWKNVVPLIKDSGLNEEELKCINRIYFWRMIFSFVIVIYDVIKIGLQISTRVNSSKSN